MNDWQRLNNVDKKNLHCLCDSLCGSLCQITSQPTQEGTTVAQSQFFTDTVIFTAAILFFVYFVVVAIILLHWRDWEVVWVFALLLAHIIALYYYFILWRRPDSPIVAFPETNLLVRPYTCLVWLLIAVYAAVKLRERYHARIADTHS